MRSQTNCELLTITIKDLERMSNEFNDEYNVLFDNMVVRLNNVLKLKIQTIKECNEAIKTRGVYNERGMLTLPEDFKPTNATLKNMDSPEKNEDIESVSVKTFSSSESDSDISRSKSKGKTDVNVLSFGK